MRIYVENPGGILWLCDWIVAAGMDHPQFTDNVLYAMRFDRLRQTMPYVMRLKEMGYAPHVT